MNVAEVNEVLRQFRRLVPGAGAPHVVKTQILTAPHKPEKLPAGWQGVYTFRFRGVWLKVGKAGPKSDPRWLSQHYNAGSSPSNLAWALLRYAHLSGGTHPRLPPGFRDRIAGINPDEIGEWIKKNTDRINIMICAQFGRGGLSKLEEIALAELRPVFEGRWRSELGD